MNNDTLLLLIGIAVVLYVKYREYINNKNNKK